MDESVNKSKNYERIFDFAFCGTYEGYSKMINYLSSIADQEKWTYGEEENNILKKYINGTFKRCYVQNKIIYSNDKSSACFNTGLLTPNCNDIICLFSKNKKTGVQPWFLRGFFDITDRKFMDLFDTVPELATYTDNYKDYYFNPDIPIIINSNHILDEHWDRISSVISLSKPMVKSLLIGVLEETKKKIKRNMRLVVPQYYNDRIMYLLPLVFPVEESTVTMALAIELTQLNQYRANTIFTREMAYEKARLLMKPEANWLI